MNKTKVINTAFVAIYYKAVNYNLLGYSFSDKIAKKFVEDSAVEVGNKLLKVFPTIIPWIKIRDKYFDIQIEEAYKKGIKQVLILGAGLDVRPLRFEYEELSFYEIDFSSTFEFKDKKFRELGLEKRSQFIGGDYLAPDLKNKLIEADIEINKPTLIIWEGNIYYQNEDKVKQLMDDLKSIFSEFTLAFDYMSTPILKKTTGDKSMDEGLDTWYKVGAPFQYPVDSVKEFAQKYNLKLEEDIRCNKMMERIVGKELPDYNIPLYNLYGLGEVSYKKSE